jgi:hypothetical protein
MTRICEQCGREHVTTEELQAEMRGDKTYEAGDLPAEVTPIKGGFEPEEYGDKY